MGFIFSNVYIPNANDNPFQFAVSYCNKTGTAMFPGGNLSVVGRNYAVFYNHSGEIAILFGCGPTTDNGFPLHSAGAICNNTVLGCVTLNVYRFLVEGRILLALSAFLTNTSVCVTNNYVCNQVRTGVAPVVPLLTHARRLPRSATLTRRGSGAASSTSASACAKSFTSWTC